MQTDAAQPKGAQNSHLLCEASRSSRAHACVRRPRPDGQRCLVTPRDRMNARGDSHAARRTALLPAPIGSRPQPEVAWGAARREACDPRVLRGQAYVSSGCLVTCATAAAGTREGRAGTKRGQASRTWAVSAAVG